MKKLGKEKIEELNEIWKNGALNDFIRRMLIYYDPMELVVMGAPDDEYDSDIGRIRKMILIEDIALEELSKLIFDLYKADSEAETLKRKSFRMAEDLLDLKNS